MEKHAHVVPSRREFLSVGAPPTTWALRQEARCGLAGGQADELEQGFMVRWALQPREPPVWTWPAARSERFLRGAALNHAFNFVKRSDFH